MALGKSATMLASVAIELLVVRLRETPMVEDNRMQVGSYTFAIEAASFRRITQSWSGPGWDFSFSGRCLNDSDGIFRLGARLLTEAAPLCGCGFANGRGHAIASRSRRLYPRRCWVILIDWSCRHGPKSCQTTLIQGSVWVVRTRLLSCAAW
jgi:hypothetical protein